MVRQLSSSQRNTLLALAGLALFGLFWPARIAVRHEQINLFLALAGAQILLCLAAAFLIWNAPPARITLVIVLGFAALLRLGLLFETPVLSDDIYRYIWDGRVQSAGINPYRYIPVDPHLAGLRDAEIFPRINRRTYAPTIYPPVAQMIFFGIHQVTGSVTGFKACLLVFEAITICCLTSLLGGLGLPRARVLIYAWNPLVLWEFSGSGHIDAAMIAFIALALVARRAGLDSWTGALLGGAALVKFFPLALFPALYRRWDWKMPLALAVTCGFAYFPYLSAGGHVFGFLSAYADEEGIRSGRYFLLLLVRQLCGGLEIPVEFYTAFVLVALALMAHRAIYCWNKRGDGFLFGAGVLAFAFTFLLSPQFPWYWTWTVPFLAFLPLVRMLPIYLFTSAALVFYAKWFSDERWLGLHPHLALGLLQLLPCAILLTSLVILRRKRPGISLGSPWANLPRPSELVG